MRISKAEPVTALRHVPIIECGEQLVDYFEVCPQLVDDKPVYDYRREHLVRVSVAEKLREAVLRLPDGYVIAILEGWRGMHIQRRMYLRGLEWYRAKNPDWSDTKLKRFVNRFTAPPDNPRVPPPHTTGGAIDVELWLEDGTVCNLYEPYDRSDPRSYPFDAPNLSMESRRNRQILYDAVAGAGITNYPSEYWHYSYGDQGWAYRGGHANAIYGATVPLDWSPHPPDVSGTPLVRLR